MESFPRALVFDVFGTAVDWRGSIIAEGAAWNKSHHAAIDWPRFADAWRARYQPSLDLVRRGDRQWTKLDTLHRESLDELLTEFGISALPEHEKDHWNRVWHRLIPWPDVVAGLVRLKKKFIIAPLSNGNFSLLTQMAKNAGLPWDAILSVELAKRYKPDRGAYLMAAELLDLEPGEVLLVGAHIPDLNGGRAAGLRTAFVHRPLEFGTSDKADMARPDQFDFLAEDFLDLAAQLGT
jgi:2-haloacid dehalogenase